MSHPAVLVMIYGAARGSSLGGRPAFRIVAEPGKRLRVTDLAATRGDGVFVPITRVEHAIYKSIDDILQENCSVEDALKRLTGTINQLSEDA